MSLTSWTHKRPFWWLIFRRTWVLAEPHGDRYQKSENSNFGLWMMGTVSYWPSWMLAITRTNKKAAFLNSLKIETNIINWILLHLDQVSNWTCQLSSLYQNTNVKLLFCKTCCSFFPIWGRFFIEFSESDYRYNRNWGQFQGRVFTFGLVMW